LSGTALVPSFRQVLQAAARRGRTLLDSDTDPKALELVVTGALTAAEGAIGKSIDAETLPQFLQRVVLQFLSAPFDATSSELLKKFLDKQLGELA
jgi:hypothetical protein